MSQSLRNFVCCLDEIENSFNRLLEAVSPSAELTERVSDLEYRMDNRYSYALKNHMIYGLTLRTSATLKEWMDRVKRFLGQTS